eukprot:CFRG3514T1
MDVIDVNGLGSDYTSIKNAGPVGMPNPLETAGIISRFTYWWVNPIVSLGTKRPLEIDDSFLVLDADEARNITSSLKANWEKERISAKEKSKQPQLYRSLIRTFWSPIIRSGIVGLLESAVRIGGAVFIGLLTQYFDEESDISLKQALWYAGGVTMTSALFLWTHHYLFFTTMRMGMTMRTSCMGLVFNKTLEMNHETLATTTTGHLVNMMSNDVTRFDQLCPFVHYTWIAPLELSVIAYLSYNEVGASCFVGIGILMLLLPFQVFSSRFFAKLRGKATLLTDERVKKMGEVLTGVRVMKMYAWENSFAKVVGAVRAEEMTHVRKAAFMKGTNLAFFFASPSIVSCAIFVTYHLTGGQLTAKKVFTVLSLLSVLALTLTLFVPFAVQGLAEIRVSLTRMEAYLMMENKTTLSDLDQRLARDQGGLHSNDEMLAHRRDTGRSVHSLDIGEKGVYVQNLCAVWRIDENNAHAKKTRARLEKKKKRKENRQREINEGNGMKSKSRRLMRTASVRLSESMSSLFGKSTISITPLSSKHSNQQTPRNDACEGESDKTPPVERESEIFDSVVHPGTNNADTDIDENIKVDPIESNVVTVRALRDISVHVGPKSLLAVVGPVGAGKSTLLLTLLGELSASKGKSVVKGSVSYTSQEAWITGGTVRENILFGLPYEKKRYEDVTECCSLLTDFVQFPDGDDSELGERGINLSGGQKARISLARCIYRRADVYLLDDPLSAVDAAVGRSLFEDCINGFLRDKTRVLVTHQLQFLQKCDMILVLEDGVQRGLGNYEDLVSKGFDFSVLLHDDDEEDKEDKRELGGVVEIDNESENDRRISVLSHISGKSGKISDVSEGLNRYLNIGSGARGEGDVSRRSSVLGGVGADGVSTSPDEGNYSTDNDSVMSASIQKEDSEGLGRFRLIAREGKKAGVVTWDVYCKYFKAAKAPVLLLLLVISFVSAQSMLLVANWWLSQWADEGNKRNTDDSSAWIYSMMVLAVFVISLVRVIMFMAIVLRSNVTLHGTMFESVLRAPVSFYDSNPTGRILNRFSKDIGTMDDILPFTFYDFLQALFMVVGIVLMVVVIVPWVLLAIVPLVIAFIMLRRYFLPASRDIKRLEGIARSPIYSTYSSVLQGLPIIRAFKANDRVLDEFYLKLNTHTRMWFSFLVTQRWLGFRLDGLCCILITVTAFVCIPLKDTLDAGLVGLLLSYVLQLQGLFQWAVRQSAEVENLMTSTERVIEYSDLPREAPTATDYPLPSNWPAKGKLEFKNLTMRYSPFLPPVLKGVDVVIDAGQKIGIVGRTGAGKSSILAALFRLTEYETVPEGSGVFIDGVPTYKIGTHTLRSNISVIPQEPILFSGTVRSNLDPFNEHADDVLMKALYDVQLGDLVESMGKGLYSSITEDGGNLSIGQKQLFCLCRAILSHNKILIMDEATANVDNKTDQLISQTLRRLFADCTILTIAHRLNTIMDSDRVMVLSMGKVLEYDTPPRLLSTPGSAFKQLYEEMEKAHSHVDES